MLTGRTIRAETGAAMGLVDRLVPVEQLDKTAKQVALSVRRRAAPTLVQRLLNSALVRPILAGQMRSQVARRARPEHYPAPYAIIELWQRHGGKGERAYEAEARSIAQLLCTPTSRNLVRVFLLQDRLKSAGKAGGEPAKHVHVVGAGVMGGDIAAGARRAASPSRCRIAPSKYVAPAIERARKFFEKRYPDPAKRDETLARLQRRRRRATASPRRTWSSRRSSRTSTPSASCMRALEPRMKPRALLATNTSSIVLEQLAQNLAATRAARRPALLQSRRADAAGRSHPRRAHAAAEGAGRPRVRAADRQAAARLPQLARLPRQPRADAVPERSDARRARKACRSR